MLVVIREGVEAQEETVGGGEIGDAEVEVGERVEGGEEGNETLLDDARSISLTSGLKA